MDASSTKPAVGDCAVCLQSYVHPAQLPCGHVFCFLCVKGVANQSNGCPMCRREIPRDFLKKPKLLEPEVDNVDSADCETQWYYEGRNGWWMYDARTNKELNSYFQNGAESCELLIAGFLYTIDFVNKLQFRRNEPLRRRNIKFETVAITAKGVAGIKCRNNRVETRVKTPENDPMDEVMLVPPSNTPASVAHSGTATPNTMELENIDTPVDQMRNLSLTSVMALIAESNMNDEYEIIDSMNLEE